MREILGLRVLKSVRSAELESERSRGVCLRVRPLSTFSWFSKHAARLWGNPADTAPADSLNGVNGTCNDCTSDCTLAVFRYRRRGLFMVGIGCDTQYDRLLLICVP